MSPGLAKIAGGFDLGSLAESPSLHGGRPAQSNDYLSMELVNNRDRSVFPAVGAGSRSFGSGEASLGLANRHRR